MKIKKSEFSSYYLNGIPKGCKQCVKGRKLVLFITGLCSRGCKYCPLSKLRKNVDKIWANERECQKINEVIKEVEMGNAHGMGITGGDPLLKIDRTIKYAKALKKRFKNFHIHLYASTKLVNKKILQRLSKVLDEIRFHPEFTNTDKELEKIKLAQLYFKKSNIGIEIPIFPDKKEEEFELIKKFSKDIGFVNLNELEIGESNFDYITNKYIMSADSYTIKDSKKAGLWILKQCEKSKLKIKVHLCTAETKNWYQFRNRLKNYKILPFGKKTDEGTVIYFFTDDFEIKKELKKKDYFIDKTKKRIILNPKKILQKKLKCKIFKVEEYPTEDKIEVEKEEIIL
jgi:pyruvate formate-lyase activating enzyme-like uncharacterized protein